MIVLSFLGALPQTPPKKLFEKSFLDFQKP